MGCKTITGFSLFVSFSYLRIKIVRCLCAYLLLIRVESHEAFFHASSFLRAPCGSGTSFSSKNNVCLSPLRNQNSGGGGCLAVRITISDDPTNGFTHVYTQPGHAIARFLNSLTYHSCRTVSSLPASRRVLLSSSNSSVSIKVGIGR